MKCRLAPLSLALFLCAPIATAAQVAGERIVPPAEFRALSEGKTLHFSRGGQFYGAEQFYTRRRSLWMFSDGECDHGEWYAEGDYICFVYEREPVPQCWHFLQREDGGYAARARGSTPEFDIFLERIDDEPLDCKGPEVGA